MKKTIIVQLNIQKTKIDQFLKLTEIMINKSSAENGCLTYKLLNLVGEENDFFIYEKYENENAVEIHNSSEHYKNFLNSVLPLLAKEPIIEIF